MTTKYTFFVHMNATKAWLSLTRSERRDFSQNTMGEIFKKYPQVNVRLYDAEAFSASCSDIAVFETEYIQDYYYLIEALRDSAVYTVPYFEIVDIIPAIEAGFMQYEDQLEPTEEQ